MAMIIGSLVAREIGQLAVAQAPMIQEFATNAVVDIAKKSFDKVLDLIIAIIVYCFSLFIQLS